MKKIIFSNAIPLYICSGGSDEDIERADGRVLMTKYQRGTKSYNCSQQGVKGMVMTMQEEKNRTLEQRSELVRKGAERHREVEKRRRI